MTNRRNGIILCRILFVLLMPHFIIPVQMMSTNSPNSANEQSASTRTPALLKFESFRSHEQYRCGQFVEGYRVDPATRILHYYLNEFIHVFSKPFPHERLPSDAFLGNINAWKDSFLNQRNSWIDYEINWLVICGLFLFLPIVFTLLYIFYRCCVCCFGGNNGDEKPNQVDHRFGDCKRIILTCVIAVFIIANVFGSVVYFNNSYYAKNELDDLPTQIHYCVNDLSLYRSETSDRVKKLLRDDFLVLNASIYKNFDSIGEAVIAALKKSTGASYMDEILIKTGHAEVASKHFNELLNDLPQTYREFDALQQRFTANKLQNLIASLQKCDQSNNSSNNKKKAELCFAARHALLALVTPEHSHEVSEQQRQMQLDFLLPKEIPVKLEQIVGQAGIVQKSFAPAVGAMDYLQSEVQRSVDTKRSDTLERLKLLDNTLFRLYEDISTQINSVNLRLLDDHIVNPMTQNQEKYRSYVNYGFIGVLIVGGTIGFISCVFLLGLFFGCCGRRPNDYDYDCCVYSTGSRLFNFASWLCILIIPLLGVLAALFMFVGSNAAWLGCHTMRDPLSRPDMLSLLDRLVEAYGLDQKHRQQSLQKSEDQRSNEPLTVHDIFSSTRRPVDLINGCIQGKTFYVMLGMDKKFKLLNGGPIDDYEHLSNAIRQTLQQQQNIHLNGRNSIHLYSDEMFRALNQLLQIQLPPMNNSAIDRFCSLRLLFQVDQVLDDLRSHRQSSGLEGSDSNIPEVDGVLQYLEEIQLEATRLHQRLNSGCNKLYQLIHDLELLQFNETAISERLESANNLLSGQDNLKRQLHEASMVVVKEIVDKIKFYANHVNHSARNSRLALCDYTLDRLNTLWMVLAISILLYIPLVILSRCLTPLYNRTYPPPHYTVNPNDTAFATDIYESRAALLRNGNVENHQVRQDRNNQPVLKISHPLQATSPYASSGGMNGSGNYGHNYNYELYPPAYMTGIRR